MEYTERSSASGGQGVPLLVKLEYRTEERLPAGVRLVEDDEGCLLNVGMIPGFLVVALGGVCLGAAGVYAVVGVRAVWRSWSSGQGLDVGLMVWVFAAVLFWGWLGAVLLRWEMRYGHLPAMYRLDEVRGVRDARGAQFEVAGVGGGTGSRGSGS